MTITRDVARERAQASGRSAAAKARNVVSGRLVGRSAELERLVEALAAPPAVAIIEGEAGIGKSRLVSELAQRPELVGRRWLVGGCRKIREPFPLGPVIEAVRGLGDDELRTATLSPVVGALRPLVPELTQWLPSTPEPLDDRAAERHRIFRGLAELLGALCSVNGSANAGRPTVLVLEDLHWADEQTAEFLTYLLGDPPPRLSVVLTYRGEEVDPGIRAVTAKLPASLRRAEVQLEPLDAEQTGTLVASILGMDRVSGQFAAHLCERASGVPFAVEELLALLRARGALIHEHGRWARKAIDDLDVPSSIRDSVLEQVSQLSEDARAVVQAAAVLQEPVPLPVLIDVSRTVEPDSAGPVEEALTSGLLVERDGAIGFRHVLAVHAVYESLTGPHRTDLHVRAATALREPDPAPLGQLAHHLRHAGRLGEWAVVAEQAAARAIELGHDEEAVRLLADVLRNAPLRVDERGRMAVKLGRAAHATVGGLQAHVELLSSVLEQELPRAIRGELRFWLAMAVERAGGELLLKRRLYVEAVDDLEDRPDLQAWAMAGLGLVTGTDVPLSEQWAWMDRMLKVLTRIEDPSFTVHLLSRAAMTAVVVGDPTWRHLTERIEQQTRGSPENRREVNAYHNLGLMACYAGHYDAAGRLLAAAIRGASAREFRSLEVYSGAAMSLLDFCRGEWDELPERLAVTLDDLSEHPLYRVDIEVVAGCLALAHGDVQGASRRLVYVAESVEEMGWIDVVPFAIAALARLAVTSGEPGQAMGAIQWLLRTSQTIGTWVPVVRSLPAAVELLIAAGREKQARDWVVRISRDVEDRDVPLAPAVLRHAQGFLAGHARDWATAAAGFLAAAELYESLECPYEAAQAREQAGLALLVACDARAEETVRAALAAYERLGATWDIARCARAARSRGMRLPAAARGGRKGFGAELSPRESDVARLAAQGRSNKEIAAELFLAPATVDKHLGRAMRKLGVHSRAAVASRLLVRSDVPPDGPP